MPIDLHLRILELKNLQTVLEVVEGVAEIVDMQYDNQKIPLRRRTKKKSNGRILEGTMPAKFLDFIREEKIDRIGIELAQNWCTKNNYSSSSAAPMLSLLAKNNILKRDEIGVYRLMKS
jgi:hypothetical protein